MEKKTAKDVGGIDNADGECSPCFDVLHGFVDFGEVQRNGVPFLHGAPCGVHHIHAAVLIISRTHQNRHRENALGNFQICSHDNFSL